jgi:hypothetical protein
MENKYYVPDISEFYVGFECEQYDDIDKQWKPYIVSKYTWTSNGMFKMYYDKPDSFRVKYLDKEDIENLGFNYGDYSKKLVNGEIIELYSSSDNRWTIHVIGDEYRDKIFDGTIKNKSELIKVLKMLGIC